MPKKGRRSRKRQRLAEQQQASGAAQPDGAATGKSVPDQQELVSKAAHPDRATREKKRSDQQELVSTVAHPDEAATHNSPTRLFDLPQELLDEIFELAYPIQDDLKVITKSKWDNKQKHERKMKGGTFVPMPFVHKVNDWMVSRQYFRLAARAWIDAQSVEVTEGYDWPSEVLFDHSSLFLDYAKKASVGTYWSSGCRRSFEKLGAFRQLKSFVMLISDKTFDVIEDKLPWTSELTEAELEIVVATNGMFLPRASRDLQELRLLPARRSIYIKSQGQRAMFALNVKRLERLVWERRSSEFDRQPDEEVEDSSDDESSDDGMKEMPDEFGIEPRTGGIKGGSKKAKSRSVKFLIFKEWLHAGERKDQRVQDPNGWKVDISKQKAQLRARQKAELKVREEKIRSTAEENKTPLLQKAEVHVREERTRFAAEETEMPSLQKAELHVREERTRSTAEDTETPLSQTFIWHLLVKMIVLTICCLHFFMIGFLLYIVALAITDV